MLKAAFAVLHAGGFDPVEQREQLSLPPQELRAGLAKTPVVVGQCADVRQVFRGRADILWPALAAVGEDGAGVEFALRAAAVRLAAAAAERVQRTGQQRCAAEKRVQQFGHLLLDREDLGTERAEIAGHGRASGVRGVLSVAYYMYKPTDCKRVSGKIQNGAKKTRNRLRRSVALRRRHAPAVENGRYGFRRGRMGLGSARALRPRLAASYATAAARPLTSESQ